MRRKVFGWLCGLFIISTLSAAGQSVTEAPDMDAALTQKWTWSMDQVASTQHDIWIVFAFERLMCENCYMGSFYNDSDRNRTSIEEVLLGKWPASLSVRKAARKAIDHIDGTEQKMVTKSMAVLIRLEKGVVTDVDISNLTSQFDFDSDPILWLGSASTSESFDVLEDLFSPRLSEDSQKGIVWAIGSLNMPDRSLEFLSDIVTDNRSEEVRKAAVYSIGNQDVARSVSILKGIIDGDESKEVQKAAIYSLGNNDTPQARQALLDIIEEMGHESSS